MGQFRVRGKKSPLSWTTNVAKNSNGKFPAFSTMFTHSVFKLNETSVHVETPKEDLSQIFVVFLKVSRVLELSWISFVSMGKNVPPSEQPTYPRILMVVQHETMCKQLGA